MTLLYRAIWNDDRAEILESTARQFQTWLESKRIDLELPSEGHQSSVTEEGPVEVTVRRAASGRRSAIQIELDEERSTGERWSTRLISIEDLEGDNWVWLDLTRVASNAVERPHLVAPRLARELIDAGLDPRVDHVRLTTTSDAIDPRGLSGLIRNSNRSLPIVVFTETPGEGPNPMIQRADAVAKRLAGAVQVVRLLESQVDEFKSVIGSELGVWGGAARIYLPSVGREGLRPDRHRYIARSQMGDGNTRIGAIVANLLSGTITARREPEAYQDVRRELKLGRNQSDSEELKLAWDEVIRLTGENQSLSSELETANNLLFDAQVDLDEEVRRSRSLESALQTISFASTHDEGEVDPIAGLDLEISSMEQAISAASRNLTHVVIPDEAPRDISNLDESTSSAAWGATTWRGLRALHLYAISDFDGDFQRWCFESGHNWSWNGSDKHLAMNESESVQTNTRLKNQRLFAISTEVDPTGKIHMWAHLKIAQGGGPLAPRVYFHDDTRGLTGKIHVGFIGPHRYTENTRTN